MIRVTRGLFRTTAVFGRRSVATKSPGSNPLEILRQECCGRKLCDEQGYRLNDAHWVCAVAVPMENKAPNLRTVHILRVSPAGFDMIFKAGGATAQKLLESTPVSLLHTQGRFVPGESAEQYRGEGFCVPIPLADLQEELPVFSLTGMMASRRWAAESGNAPDARQGTGVKAHWTQILQQTRQDLENDRISMEEMEECVQAFRFRPDRLEYMAGTPGALMWDRWEWISESKETPMSVDDPIEWGTPRNLVPH
ncbi:hypothetical protein FisN_10Lh308 [Fistulifera solaris]|uniref:Uncharacterized protein n=1 Tax=Fistulifera solaris TaxID=1519565 RepID=A0A1Z5KFW7_FISSO|nr:hypothetical protein FisN_10Lh308 [Fistulifera solaris]|eukprot:GAX25107.1 hypothetical protein FisN_10Lh308 [Fistulifera solaris]